MDKAKFEAVMERMAKAAPDQASPEIMSLIIANLVLLFEQQDSWPQMMMAVTATLSAAISEEREEHIARNEEAAVRAANEFMAGILNKSQGMVRTAVGETNNKADRRQVGLNYHRPHKNNIINKRENNAKHTKDIRATRIGG